MQPRGQLWFALEGICKPVWKAVAQKKNFAAGGDLPMKFAFQQDFPRFVKSSLTELQNAPVPQNSDPAITFTAVDDRGQDQSSITFLGTFQRCDEVSAPKTLVSGKSYSTCMTYLIPGGGSIQSVKWDSGPSPANDVSPYFDKPIVWGA